MEYPLLNNTYPEPDESHPQDDQVKEYRRKNRFLILIIVFFAMIVVGLVLNAFSPKKNSVETSKFAAVPTDSFQPTVTLQPMATLQPIQSDPTQHNTYTSEDGSFSFNYPSNWVFEKVDYRSEQYGEAIEFKYDPRFAILTILELAVPVEDEMERLSDLGGDRIRVLTLGGATAKELTGCVGVEGCRYEHLIFVSHRGKNYEFVYTTNGNVLGPEEETVYNNIVSSLKFNP